MSKPPYTVTENILQLVVNISEKLGIVRATHLYKPQAELRKANRIKSIQSSLEIEGNTLSENQITAIFDNKRVLGPKNEILEVKNAIQLYREIKTFKYDRLNELKRAHAILMNGLIPNAGSLRIKNAGIVKGGKVEHLAPGGGMVNGLMKDLFYYLKNDNEITLIKSCVFHYELEFIHPFADGNGRIGRFWQTLILIDKYPVFEFLPIESLIKENQKAYYKALGLSDSSGTSTPFIEFMLGIILQSLDDLIQTQNRSLSVSIRINLYKDFTAANSFSRKDYLQHFKNIAQATASRDLKWAVDKGIIEKSGERRLTRYKYLFQ